MIAGIVVTAISSCEWAPIYMLMKLDLVLSHPVKKIKREQERAQNKAHEAEHAPKKAKSENEFKGHANEKSKADIAADYEKFCKATWENLSIDQMRQILKANAQNTEGPDDAVVARCQDMLFYGPPDRCPVCGSYLQFNRTKYSCRGAYSDWSTCTFSSREPQRNEGAITFPGFVEEIPVYDVMSRSS